MFQFSQFKRLLSMSILYQVPARLRRLEPVNAVLAHRPSSLSPAHIKVFITIITTITIIAIIAIIAIITTITNHYH